jgi:hypothetical protein
MDDVRWMLECLGGMQQLLDVARRVIASSIL